MNKTKSNVQRPTSKAKPDKYDRAIAFLSENPDYIKPSWFTPEKSDIPATKKAHCLFQFASPSGRPYRDCACLTQIRSGEGAAFTVGLTKQISGDERIPKNPNHVRVEHLPVFAEWQRRLDRELRRKTTDREPRTKDKK